MKANYIQVRPDEPTAFLICTGLIRYFKNKMDNYGGDAAGPTLETETSLISIGGVLTWSGTVSYEQMIIVDHPVQCWMMQDGILMNEVLDLEEVCGAGGQ
jgi:hypothetical protein